MSQEAILRILMASPGRGFRNRELARLIGASYGATARASQQLARYREVDGQLVQVVTGRTKFYEWRYRYPPE